MRVAFPLSFYDRSWMGGVSYFRNLFAALDDQRERAIDPIVVAGMMVDQEITNSLGAREVHLTRWADVGTWRWKLRRSLAIGIGFDVLFEHILQSMDVRLLSHFHVLGRWTRTPSLAWIPDFQELYLPDFFSAAEIARRSRTNRAVVRDAAGILLSSEHAREGLATISKDAADRAYVLPFVASVPPLSRILPLEQLERKFGPLGGYFFLPNQFWAHKNHRVVVQALDLLRKRGRPVAIIATGNATDHRQPQHGQHIMRLISECGVAADFRLLGMVSYEDLMSLMAHSTAVLNPSLFEGWSTSVEEAKSLGKTIVVSDIPVHREQAPCRARYFAPESPNDLADALLEVLSDHDPDREAAKMAEAQAALPDRRSTFARRYREIAEAVVNNRK